MKIQVFVWLPMCSLLVCSPVRSLACPCLCSLEFLHADSRVCSFAWSFACFLVCVWSFVCVFVLMCVCLFVSVLFRAFGGLFVRSFGWLFACRFVYSVASA